MSRKLSISEQAEVMAKVFNECEDLRIAGQAEYAHDESNAHRNFDALADELGIKPEQILQVYMKKHLDGINAYIKGHKSQRESVTGRINDCIVYLVLLRGMVEREEGRAGDFQRGLMEPGVRIAMSNP